MWSLLCGKKNYKHIVQNKGSEAKNEGSEAKNEGNEANNEGSEAKSSLLKKKEQKSSPGR